MNELGFTPEEMQQINSAIQKRFRARMAAQAEPIKTSMLLERKKGLAVTEGMCPHCRKEMERVGKVGTEIHWRCVPCGSLFRVVDPRTEIDNLIGGGHGPSRS